MSAETWRCESCGGLIVLDGSTEFFCPDCGQLYREGVPVSSIQIEEEPEEDPAFYSGDRVWRGLGGLVSIFCLVLQVFNILGHREAIPFIIGLAYIAAIFKLRYWMGNPHSKLAFFDMLAYLLIGCLYILIQQV